MDGDDDDREALIGAEPDSDSPDDLLGGDDTEEEDDELSDGDDDAEEEEEGSDDEEDRLPLVLVPAEANGDNDDDEASSDEDDDACERGEREAFDTDLPTRHAYLGAANAVGGRTILEEDLVQEIVTFTHPGIILMPGQTMPLTVFRPNHISAMRKLIDSSKTFGSLYARLPSVEGPHEEAKIGTTAEIYEYGEPAENSLEIGLKMKVKGRQRFRVLSSRSTIDGTRMSTVAILRERRLPDPMSAVRLRCLDRWRAVAVVEGGGTGREDSEGLAAAAGGDAGATDSAKASSSSIGPGRKRKNSFRERLDSLLLSLRKKKPTPPSNRQELMPDVVPFKFSPFNHLRTRVYRAPLTPWPNWVYEMYDSKILVEQVHILLTSLRLFSQAKVSIPSDPEELSFWVACNLPITDKQRYRILQLNCAMQRLRYELALMKKYQVFCCRNCNQEIATQDDIFSMSQEGPQSAYVNPSGFVHETLTLYNAKRLYLVGSASTEYSWFPGYAWTIAQCRGCQSHMGWKFTAAERRLHPKKFWGISRINIVPSFKANDEEEDGRGEGDAEVGGGETMVVL